MSAAGWFQLPPLLRADLILRFGWPSARRTALHPLINGNRDNLESAVPSGRRNALQCCSNKSRAYATERTDTFDMSSKNEPLLPPSMDVSGGYEDKATVSTSQQKTSAEASEQAQLIALLQRRLRKRISNPERRRKYKARIHQVLREKDPLPTLRLMFKRSAKLNPGPEDSKTASTTGGSELTGSSIRAVNTTKADLPASIQLLDLEYVQQSQPLPSQVDYPEASPELFRPQFSSVAIHSACSKLKTSLQTEVDFTSRHVSQVLSGGRKDIKVCTLTVSIPDLVEVTATGEGFTKQSAKQAAWLLVVSKMHVAGTLRELFPSALDESPDSSLPKPVIMDAATMESERDAKTDIYNYAASFGMVPIFHVENIQHLTRRARLSRTLAQSKPLYQANIKLLGQEIDVTAISTDPTSAEIAACIAFKNQAEARHKASDGEIPHPTSNAYKVLNVDTARQFFEFYKNRRSGMNLEIEHERIEGDYTRNTARLTVNGEAIGDPVTMPTKKKAEALVFLVAAVKTATSSPGLLDEFSQAKSQKGKLLRPLDPIDMEIGYDALQSMQQAMLDARNAGLPDVRQTLDAELMRSGADHTRPLRRLSTNEHRLKSIHLRSRQKAFDSSADLSDLRSKKAALPMNQSRQDVLSMVTRNQYSIIIGETGSGKTTQVPQILFEDAVRVGSGSSCNIICTQPRRIATTSVARRVAIERNEDLRDNVGYHVRFDAKPTRNPYGITYCTTGILLEKLKRGTDSVLDSVSHIIVDEVHERDLNIDFLLIILKRAIEVRQAKSLSVPKVVLMSATLDGHLFANYLKQADPAGRLQPCPILKVPGRTFPVTQRYLGSIMHEMLEARESDLNDLLQEDKKSHEYLRIETQFSASHSQPTPTAQPETIIDWKRERQATYDSEEDASHRREREEALVPVSLVAATIAHICSTSQDGAILTFLPGLDEIINVKKILMERKPFAIDFMDKSKFQICLLHSSVPKEEQDEVFRPCEPSCRKIILSTNIAETSVTVPEVKYVVDTGKLRETRYDQTRRITRLPCVWESKSNLKQRAGRAGRVQDGFYYGLFCKERADSLRAVGLPELLRTDLQETCLSIQAQSLEEPIASFLGQAIEPPPQPAVDAAISGLVETGALTGDEQITALGRVLSRLPAHPSLGKMIILGIIFKCLDPMILLGAAAGERPLFVTPLGLREEADKAHRSYTGETGSDHIGFLKAFEELRMITDQVDAAAAARRGHEQYLHMGAFRAIRQTAEQIVEILEKSGLVPKQTSQRDKLGPSELNQNAGDHELIKALLLAGVHPNLAARVSTKGPVCRTATEPSVLIHPSSVNSEGRRQASKHPCGTLFTYSALSLSSEGNTIFMRDSTPVHPLLAALFGGELRMTGRGQLEMDDWLPLNVKASSRNNAAKLILEFRKALDRVLHGAFASLAGISGESECSWADDPVRAQFASRVVEILQKRLALQSGGI